jgi:hypothetical protein
VRTSPGLSESETGTFAQLKRRDQLIDCAIDAIAELGVEQVLELGQASGRLGPFSARVVAAAVKAALDNLRLTTDTAPSRGGSR